MKDGMIYEEVNVYFGSDIGALIDLKMLVEKND